MVNFYTMPNGCWIYDNGTYKPAHFRDSQVFVSSGAMVSSHEPYGVIGQNNVANFLDPSDQGTTALNNRKLCMELELIQGQQDLMRLTGTSIFNADYTGFTPNVPAYPSGSGGTTPATQPQWSISGGLAIDNTQMLPFTPTISNGTPNTNGTQGANDTNRTQVVHNNNNTTGSDDLPTQNPENHSAQFSSRLKLIEQYCNKYGNVVDINEIKSKYASDPKAGVEYCDKVINEKFDQSRVEKLVKKQYNEYIEAQKKEGNTISNKWVFSIQVSGPYNTPKIETSNLNANNILDAIGTFMTNSDVRNGRVSMEQLFEEPDTAKQLIEALKAKANQTLANKDLKEETRETIARQLGELVDLIDNYPYKLQIRDHDRQKFVTKYVELFNTLRNEQATRNDAAAKEYYGVPKDSSIKFDEYTNMYNEEIKSHNNRLRLSRSI